MTRYYLIPLSFLLLIPALYGDEGLTAFREAMRSFKAGDYAVAVSGFERAQSLGMDKPALYYNLGVVYYRLARWEEAIAAFRKTADYPDMAPLAYYNIGLVRRRQNDPDAARVWLQRALDNTTDGKLLRLTQNALDSLAQKKESDWSSFLSMGLGYDDNLTLESDTSALASETSDVFYEFFGFTQGVLSGAYQHGWLFRGSLFADLYDERSDYSLAELNLGLYRRLPIASWQTEGGFYTTWSTLDGDPYLSSGNLVFDTRRTLSDSLTLRFRLRFKAIHSLQHESEGLEGEVFDMRSEGIWAVDEGGGRLRSYYELELNDREDIETPTSFTSLSPTRHILYLEYRRDLTPDWQVKTSGSYRRSRYNQANRDAGGLSETRLDKRLNLALELSRLSMWKGCQLGLEYRYTDNRSNIDSYSYSRNILLINIMKSY